MDIRYKLPPLDGQKSYWGKAIVVENDIGKHLISYGSRICTIDDNNGVHIYTDIPRWDSNTSLRHLRSFLQRFNHPVGSKAELKKMYT